jgi:hypothetical protein
MMKNSAATKAGLKGGLSASDLIDRRIQELGDWRGKTLGRVRALLKKVDPEIVEEWKWMGTPVFSRDGIICTGETYKTVVKLTFAKGASLKDPARLFNSSLDGNVRRAIDLHENETLNEPALKALVREAIALNMAGKAKKTKTVKSVRTTPGKPVTKSAGRKPAKETTHKPTVRRKTR